MFSKLKKEDLTEVENREQYQYARARIVQKKRLMQHFIIFLVGSVMLVIIDPILGIGKDFFISNWFIWAILIWLFLILVHVFKVVFMNNFMDKEWEDRQLEKLKVRQVKRITELEKQINVDIPLPDVKKNDLNNPSSHKDQ